jgi:hypothetical protein
MIKLAKILESQLILKSLGARKPMGLNSDKKRVVHTKFDIYVIFETVAIENFHKNRKS